MQQKQLAQLLDISPAMVSRLAKRGMPVDTLERAERWRKRHLEPGRVKGSRFGTSKATPLKTASPKRPALDMSDDDVATAGARLDSVVMSSDSTLADVEAVGQLADAALVQGNPYAAAVRTHQLRGLLADMAADASPRLSVRAWVALLDFMLHEEAKIKTHPDMGELLTPEECGALFGPACPWPAHVVVYEACDYDHNSLIGWPDGFDDDDDD
ncbi:MAG: hypothetical protein ABIR56_14250 [Polaromonas sp.]